MGKGWRGGKVLAPEGPVAAISMAWGERGGAGAMASTMARVARSSAFESGGQKAGLMRPALVFRVVTSDVGLGSIMNA